MALVVLTALGLARPGASRAAVPNGGWDAAWAPDGAHLAFTAGSPHSIPNLWVVGADKAGLRQLTTRGAHEPQWLRDGKTIVFGTLRNGSSTFMSVDMNGAPGSEKPVDALPPGAEWPVWSPDGSLVAYGVVSKDGDSRDLGFARTSGGRPTGLTSKFWCREWAWSPDGSAIAFVVGRSTGTSLWVADVATRDVRLLYKGYCRTPAYSPDGKQLAIAVPDVRSAYHIDLLDLSTGQEKAISVPSFNGQKIVWSPDGRRLFFGSSRKSEPSIWSIGADGLNATRLTPKGTPAMGLALSPDGRKIACQVMRPSAYGPEVSVFGADAQATPATANATGTATGSGTATGTATGSMTIAQASAQPGTRPLIDITGGSNPSFWSPVWSPDGREIAFQSDLHHTAELITGSVSGRMGKVCTPLNGPDVAAVSWLADGKRLMVADAGRILLVNKAGGKNAATPLPKLTASVQGARLAGDEVFFTEWGLRDAVLTAVKLDGSGRRALTQRPQPKPSPKSEAAPGATPGVKPDAGPGMKPIMRPDTTSHTAQSEPSSPQPNPQSAPRDGIARPVIQKTARRGSAGFSIILASDHTSTAPPMIPPAVRTPVQAMPPSAAPAMVPPAAPAAEAEVGNPHASLGQMGPQANLAKVEEPPVLDLNPAVSPDHKTVAFTRNDQVWLVKSDGTGERQITKLASDEGSARALSGPVWSPDGASILFLAFNTAPGKMALELWLSRADAGAEAGSERLLYTEDVDTEYGVYYTDCSNGPAFVPDGKRILFTSLAGGEPHIASIALDGSDLREVVPAPSSFPALDASGRRLAYVDLSDFHERIRILDLATGKSSGPLYKK